MKLHESATEVQLHPVTLLLRCALDQIEPPAVSLLVELLLSVRVVNRRAVNQSSPVIDFKPIITDYQLSLLITSDQSD